MTDRVEYGDWWFVLEHAVEGVPCSQDGRTWGMQVEVSGGLVPLPPPMMCTECLCQMEIVYSSTVAPGESNAAPTV